MSKRRTATPGATRTGHLRLGAHCGPAVTKALSPGHRHVPATRWARLIREFALAVAAAAAYVLVRGLTASSADSALDNAQSLVRLERSLGISASTLSRSGTSSSPADSLANWVYIWGHCR